MSILSAEELLAGSKLTHEVELPATLLAETNKQDQARVVIQPLTVRDLQRIRKAAREDENLSAALMIHHALVEPKLPLDQVSALPAGLAQFLLGRIHELSGMGQPRDVLHEWVQAPLARACFTLAKEFGWTPEEVSGMTIGQILLFLEMSQQQASAS